MNATKSPISLLKKYQYDSNNQRTAVIVCQRNSRGQIVIGWSAISGGDSYDEFRGHISALNRTEKFSKKVIPQRLMNDIGWMIDRAAKNFEVPPTDILVSGKWVEDLNAYRRANHHA